MPANTGARGSSPAPGRSHMPQSSEAHAPQLLSQVPRACALKQEKPPQGEACVLQQRVPPACNSLRKPEGSNEDPAQPKIMINK